MPVTLTAIIDRNGNRRGNDGRRQPRGHDVSNAKTSVHICTHGEGGAETGNFRFKYKMPYALKDEVKEAILSESLGNTPVWNPIRAEMHMAMLPTAKHARILHDVLRPLAPDALAGDIEIPTQLAMAPAPELQWLFFKNPGIKAVSRKSNTTVSINSGILLQGLTYPIIKFIKPMGFDFFENMNGAGGRAWIKGTSDADDLNLEKMTAVCDKYGYQLTVDELEIDAGESAAPTTPGAAASGILNLDATEPRLEEETSPADNVMAAQTAGRSRRARGKEVVSQGI